MDGQTNRTRHDDNDDEFYRTKQELRDWDPVIIFFYRNLKLSKKLQSYHWIYFLKLNTRNKNKFIYNWTDSLNKIFEKFGSIYISKVEFFAIINPGNASFSLGYNAVIIDLVGQQAVVCIINYKCYLHYL